MSGPGLSGTVRDGPGWSGMVRHGPGHHHGGFKMFKIAGVIRDSPGRLLSPGQSGTVRVATVLAPGKSVVAPC